MNTAMNNVRSSSFEALGLSRPCRPASASKYTAGLNILAPLLTVTLLLGCLLPSATFAAEPKTLEDEPKKPAGDGLPRLPEEGRDPARGPQVFRLTLHPAPEPKPALKYPLLPPVTEIERGNAALNYAGNLHWGKGDRVFSKQLLECSSKSFQEVDWTQVEPLFDESFKTYCYKNLAKGARKSLCDWELPAVPLDEQLPLLGAYRHTVNVLSLYARSRIARGKFEEANQIIQTGMAVSNHVSSNYFIHALVKSGSFNRMLLTLHDWVQQPGAPNLYWSLTQLPAKHVDLTRAVGREIAFVMDEDLAANKLFTKEEYQSLATRVLASKEADNLVGKLKTYSDIYGSSYFVEKPLFEASLPEKLREKSQRWLLEHGLDAKLVELMPAVQVYLLQTLLVSREFSDEQAKWMVNVPFPTAQLNLQQLNAEFEKAKLENPFLTATATSMPRSLELVTYPDRRVAVLRVVEAIRMYAADHDGQLPKSLDAITAVPIPDDPMTGKPFTYRLEGEMAILEALSVNEKIVTDGWRYELTIAKPK